MIPEPIPQTSAPSPVARLLAHPLAGTLLLVAVPLALFLAGLGRPFFWDPDEGRHAEIAREALLSGNWITPTLNFEPYHDKPMFIYWLVGGCFRLFGLQEWAGRLPSALAALLTVWATAWWGRRYFGALVGSLAALCLATAGMFVVLGRFVLIDMTFSLWMTVTLLTAGAWLIEGRERGWPFWPIYVPMALATLAKGPAAIVLSGLVLALPAYRAGLLRRWREVQIPQGLLILGLLAGTWYAAAALKSPDYVKDFLWRHNVGRFANAETGHPMNPFAYFYLLPLTFLPWSLLLPAAVAAPSRPGKERAVLAWQYCLVWVGVIFVFFTLSRAKLPSYMLPLFAPLSLLLAVAMEPLVRGERPSPRAEVALHVGYALGALLLLLVPVAAGVAIFLGVGFAAIPRTLVLFLGWPLAYCGYRAATAGRHDHVLACFFAATLLCYGSFYGPIVPAINDQGSLKGAAQALSALPTDTPVTAWEAVKNSLVFYLERRVETVEAAEAAAAALSGPGPAALLTKRRVLEELRCHLKTDAWVWWQGERIKVLLVNRPPAGETATTAERISPKTCPEPATGSDS